MPLLIVQALAVLGPLLKDLIFKVLVALGVSFVSYESSKPILLSLMNYVSDSYFSIPDDALNVLALAGVPFALNTIFGAFNFAVGIIFTGKALKFMKV